MLVKFCVSSQEDTYRAVEHVVPLVPPLLNMALKSIRIKRLQELEAA